jgi:hypothetical protein
MTLLRATAACAAILACLLWRCSSNSIAGGNSSDTGNVVAIAASNAGIVVTVQRPLQIDVFDVSYLPFRDSGYHAWSAADSGDSIVFDVPASGYYNVLVQDSAEGTGLFASGVPVLADSLFEATYDSLGAVGGIAGAAMNTSADSTLYWTFVYIAGSPFWDYTVDKGVFSLDNIPPGTYEMQFYGLTATEWAVQTTVNAAPRTLAEASDSVTVSPGQTTTWSR